MCAEILQLNIQYLENDVIASEKKKYNQDNDFLKPSLDELIHASSTLLEYSELLGNEKLVKKYTKMVEKYNEMKAQLEDPGFEFEA